MAQTSLPQIVSRNPNAPRFTVLYRRVVVSDDGTQQLFESWRELDPTINTSFLLQDGGKPWTPRSRLHKKLAELEPECAVARRAEVAATKGDAS